MVCRKLVCFSVSCKCRMFLGFMSNMSYVCVVLSKKFSFMHFGLILLHGILLICIVFQSLQYMLSIHTVQQLSCLCRILVGFTFNFIFLACLRSIVDMNILVLFHLICIVWVLVRSISYQSNPIFFLFLL